MKYFLTFMIANLFLAIFLVGCGQVTQNSASPASQSSDGSGNEEGEVIEISGPSYYGDTSKW